MALTRAAAGLVAVGMLASAVTTSSASADARSDRQQRTQPALRVVTFNVFQNLGLPAHRQDWRRLRSRADVVLLQETTGFRVRDMVHSRRWRAVQADGDRAESAVVVRRSAVRKVGAVRIRRISSSHDCEGADIGPRYVVSARLVLRGGARIRVASTHLPHPGCADSVYAAAIRHLRRWVRGHHGRLVIGADWNRTVADDPGGLGAHTRLRPYGVGIDGFEVDHRLHVVRTHRLGGDEDWASDHEPVRVTLHT
jgi:endonuclease/exonuclease/phosphatase family metal-dependent hydrolase